MFSGARTGKGGFAKLKTVVDQLKSEADSKGIPSLYLDGGDFGEGSSFFFSDYGVDSLRALDLLGVDVTVLGNHDYMLGGRELAHQIKRANLKSKIISANLKGKRLLGLNNMIPSYVDYNFDGVRMRILGLSTSEIHYQYPLRPMGRIANSIKSAASLERKAQKDGIDYVVALTHLGIYKDIELVQKSKFIDLVVGAHSHTLITSPELIKNALGKEVPILQAGAHSLYAGSLLIDLLPEGKSKILQYQIHPIHEALDEDPIVREFVTKAHKKKETYFNRQWDEVIGYSKIPLSGTVEGMKTSYRTCWSEHVARLTRDVARAHLSIQFDEFMGEEIPPGEITFGDIIDNFPHFRKWNDEGWKIKKAWIQGYILKRILMKIADSSYATTITIDGLQFYEESNKTFRPFHLINDSIHQAYIGEYPLRNTKYYSVAMPSEVPHALLKTFNILGYVLFNNLRIIKNSNYWDLIEDYIKDNSPLECLDREIKTGES
jgi:2',3'-cyclic-nucleotide 2'-phosphodiesterase (5'-nucleotidase family)